MQTSLPNELVNYLRGEEIEFSVYSKRANPIKNSIFSLIFGFVWLSITSIFVYGIIVPIISGKTFTLEINGVNTIVKPGNLEPVILPIIIISVFVLIGIFILIASLYSMFKTGGYFVGTKNRLVNYRNGNFNSTDWSQFSGDIKMSGNDQNGNIELGLKTGRMVYSKNSRSQYVQDIIYISSIKNAKEVERICRKNIESKLNLPGEADKYEIKPEL